MHIITLPRRRDPLLVTFQYSIGDAKVKWPTALRAQIAAFLSILHWRCCNSGIHAQRCVQPSLSILHWRCYGSTGATCTRRSSSFQYSIGDARIVQSILVETAKKILSILHWRCLGISRKVVQTYLNRQAFNTPLEMRQYGYFAAYSSNVKSLSILHWRCQTVRSGSAGGASDLGFQYSIGDA